jgi:hypothetical protein
MSFLITTILKSNLYKWHNVRVILLLAFKFYEVVIGAAGGSWKLATGKWARVVDRTFPRFLIQKHAGLSKQPISFAPQNSFFAEQFRKAPGCNFGGHAKVR